MARKIMSQLSLDPDVFLGLVKGRAEMRKELKRSSFVWDDYITTLLSYVRDRQQLVNRIKALEKENAKLKGV